MLNLKLFCIIMVHIKSYKTFRNRTRAAILYQKWKCLIFWDRITTVQRLRWNFVQTSRPTWHLPVCHAKFHTNRCNESPLWGDRPDFRPVSKFNTGTLRFVNPVGNNKICMVIKPQVRKIIFSHRRPWMLTCDLFTVANRLVTFMLLWTDADRPKHWFEHTNNYIEKLHTVYLLLYKPML